MIHSQLNYQIAQQRIDEARRAAERERFARSIHADSERQPRPTVVGRLTRRRRVAAILFG